ncbi:hypothetical protein EZV73_09065 [Acidaminobacter sp. JC074]|uniref:nitroreductase family protein n=1 Tax=Acidaminobacter sp. JC074 TaxID=2530199 RepID=UPI001F113B1B|nr:nitroreductase family protein [Acidaminobacter sp. JC074]MCH4887722.1 hypothetical protein [Acidaminobacter sp. JC074]
MSLIDAVFNRRSVRSFLTDPIQSEKKSQLLNFINNLEVPFEHSVQVKLFEASGGKKLYTMFTAPKDNFAIMSETDMVSISKAGFIGELVLLYATDLGISTCWFGHYHLRTLNDLMPHMTPSENDPRWSYGKGPVDGTRVIAISPLAYHKEKGLRIIDRLQSSMMSHKRKALDELLVGKKDLSEDIYFALDLARLAPSAGNLQFWRFDVSEDEKLVRVAMPVGYKHPKWEHPNVDIGIAASHIFLGLKERGIDFSVDIKEEEGCAVWYFRL